MTLPQKPNLGHASETHPSSAQREKSGGIGTKSVLREPVKKKNVENSTKFLKVIALLWGFKGFLSFFQFFFFENFPHFWSPGGGSDLMWNFPHFFFFDGFPKPRASLVLNQLIRN